MKTSEDLKRVVREKYGDIALSSPRTSCCGPKSSCCTDSSNADFAMIGDDYKNIDGYIAEADLGLGCGIPTEYAEIKKGDTVVDLGSGAGNDVFVARAITGEEGKVIGIDFTEEMLAKANRNNKKLGYKNVEFKLGEIENMPLDDEIADVVVSNCVLNLVPDKTKAFSEVYRILKPGGHFCISDIVIQGEMSEELKNSTAMYAGCVSGALKQEEYLDTIAQSGFKNVEIKKTKRIDLPDDLLKNYLDEEGIKSYKENVEGIFSITVVGYKK
ncbi:MAG: arsenite S-adenosylmethyltransferase [Ignavibacteria bacterium RIFOXYB2_FULL_35_12]|nr:MAG: arsenite S-adenosylmethyltransferase [Ignavibacteria bacterium GWA2_36_19]OGU51908.1 MAG: arsenite S-adenosylmethyltransferase [Ignavibacteria bacterium GWC2_35_8]OGU59679.1 MAG: arsenite S-adenosylmethyltransferase [Ignavibacteria bacterium GWF2_35_20]OGU85147.1 MAG: arsenite S-adenosylmethyltransferase [Ignavibacteria bacterium RIFOXYA12_FULL_35_25]OGU91842.1 MAG: arsenite S-adenosylmethyltransferase [Ignavibacteria bacterium RIFOXYC12_FULL_35_11]OGU97499.1 MAG: arsenite S-adenosylme